MHNQNCIKRHGSENSFNRNLWFLFGFGNGNDRFRIIINNIGSVQITDNAWVDGGWTSYHRNQRLYSSTNQYQIFFFLADSRMSEKNVNSVRTLAMCRVIFKSNRVFRAGGKNFFFIYYLPISNRVSVFPPKPENPIFDTPPNITIYTHIY